MAIAALVLWMFTAGVGVYLLMATIAARRARTGAPGGPEAAPEVPATAVPPPRVPVGGRAPSLGGGPQGTDAGVSATAGATQGLPAEPPPIPRVRVKAGPDDHPLMEFTHPALAIGGLGAWLAYVASRYPAFAWISFAALVIAIGVGLGWLTTSARAAKRRHREKGGGRAVPLHLIVLHGLGAGVTFALAVLTVLTVGHI